MKVLSFGAIFNLSGFLGITANLARREDYAFTIKVPANLFEMIKCFT